MATEFIAAVDMVDLLVSRYEFQYSNFIRDIKPNSRVSDYQKHLRQAMKKCDVMLMVIGSEWADHDDSGSPTLIRPSDPALVEMKVAFDLDIPVIVVLVDNARLPMAGKLLTSLQRLKCVCQVRLRRDTYFKRDIAKLF